MKPQKKQVAPATRPNLPWLPSSGEARSLPTEMRMAGDDSRTVVGKAAVFNSWSRDLGGFIERVHKGAFDKAIPVSDIRALFNHNADKILARSKRGKGTMNINVDRTHLNYRFDSPETTYGNDLIVSLNRGDIDESSFAFDIDPNNKEAEDWTKNEKTQIWERNIYEVRRIYDVSPVTYAAYEDTSVAKRNLQRVQNYKAKTMIFFRRDLAARELSIL